MKRTFPKLAFNSMKPLKWQHEGDCTICTSHAPNANGYPVMRRNNKNAMSVARHVLFRSYGAQPKTIQARHTCDNRLCINPDHILPGTTQDNTADRVSRGRSARYFGSTNVHSKLTEPDILKIRQLFANGMSQKNIAIIFGIHQTNAHYIITRKTWPHI